MNMRLILCELPADEEPAAWMARVREWVTDEELAASAGFAPHRRREYLVWRAAVRQELGRGTDIRYDAAGAPQVGGGMYISVSHSQRLVVVCVADAPCAVDTEPLTRNFDRVRRRYMTDSEAALNDDPRLAAAVWCAKEALYKLEGREGCDFLRDISVTEVDFDKGRICGAVYGGKEIQLEISYLADNIIVSSKSNC